MSLLYSISSRPSAYSVMPTKIHVSASVHVLAKHYQSSADSQLSNLVNLSCNTMPLGLDQKSNTFLLLDFYPVIMPISWRD